MGSLCVWGQASAGCSRGRRRGTSGRVPPNPEARGRRRAGPGWQTSAQLGSRPFAPTGHEAPCAGLTPKADCATVINIKGDSYRMREKRQAGLFPGAVALEPTTKGAPSPKPKLARR